MENKPESQQELIPKPDAQENELSAFIPIAEKWIDGNNKSIELNHEIDKEELKLAKESNKRSYNLLIIIILGVFSISSGIIFFLKNLEAGLLVLSHVGAVVAGLLAGMGIQKTRSKEE